jgi:hypothetical protein
LPWSCLFRKADYIKEIPPQESEFRFCHPELSSGW